MNYKAQSPSKKEKKKKNGGECQEDNWAQAEGI